MGKIKQAESLSDQAYHLLKSEVISGKLQPEQDLPEEKLASELGISRTPLRDALRRLEMDGLVHLRKGRSAKVASFTMEDSLQSMEIRQLLEIHNIKKTAARFSKERMDEVKANMAAQWKAVEQRDYHSFIELDREFHLMLAAPNPNIKLKEMIYQMNTGSYRAFLILSNTLHVSAVQACEEHEGIIKALEKQDISLAAAQMTTHMKNIETRILSSTSVGAPKT
ncbi:GntR family transcriptional regulator [Virgibacillus sediminis]|uniref:GntR family transcriptional regulator n=1 Tax=Virgibacillus sediminis TaxID=202260 RepID=A0ABV7AA51_9BACI